MIEKVWFNETSDVFSYVSWISAPRKRLTADPRVIRITAPGTAKPQLLLLKSQWFCEEVMIDAMVRSDI
jgi:hypothetical protein